MTTYFINHDRTVNGAGSEGDPFNTVVGMPAGAHDYRFARGTTIREQWTMPFGTSGARVFDYGEGALPVFDCESTRSTGVTCDARAGVEFWNLEFRNQNAAAPAAGLQISGSTGGGCHVHDCVFRGNRIALHINNSPGNRIKNNLIYCGHPSYLTNAYGIRVNGANALRNEITFNKVFGSASHAHVDPIQAYGAPYTAILGNEIDGTMSDGISVFIGSDYSTVVGNLVYGSLLKDGIAIEDSDSPHIYNNTVWHQGDLDGHSGPCLKIGDNFGAGTAPIDVLVRNNILVGFGRLPMTLDPVGGGAVFSNNLYRKVGGVGDAIVNYNDGGLVSLNFAAWLAEGLDANSLNQDPLLDSSYRPRAGSPVIGAGIQIPGIILRDFYGKHIDGTPDIGAIQYRAPRSAVIRQSAAGRSRSDREVGARQ